jgi:hypothetical protein
MPDQLTLANMNVRIAGSLEELDRTMREAVKRAEKEGTAAGRAFTRGFQKAGGAKGTGANVADQMLDGLTKQFEGRRAEINQRLARGLINKSQAEKMGRDAARSFDQGLLAGMARMDRRGQLTREMRTQLGNALKNVGEEATASTGGINGMVKGLLGLGAVVGVLAAVHRGIALLRGTIDDAETLAKSYLKLDAAAKLFGVDQKDLNALAATARTEYKLNASAANELAVQTTKLAARAGDAAKAQDILTAALDLGAAQGFDAQQVALALDQTLRGLDEGTDKLFQQNPSQIYAEYARGIGKTAATLTDLEQKQALVNKVLTEGQKVLGSYDRFLDSNIGQLSAWRLALQTARETIGTTLIPVVVELSQKLAGPLATSVRLITDLLEMFLDPADRVINRLQQMGVAAEIIAPMAARQGMVAGRENIDRLKGRLRGPVFGRETPTAETIERMIRETEPGTRSSDVRVAERSAERLAYLHEALAIVQQIKAEEMAIAKIEGDLSGLDAKQKKALEIQSIEQKIVDLQKVESAGNIRLISQLEERKRVLETELGRTGGEKPTVAKPGPSPEEQRKMEQAMERAKKLVDDWRDTNLSELQLRINKWKEYEAAAKAIGDSNAAAAIRAQRIEMEKSIARIDKIAPGIQKLVGLTTGGMRATSASGGQQVVGAVMATARSLTEQLEAELADARFELSKGLISSKDFEQRERRAMQRYQQQLLRLMTTLQSTGKVGQEAFEELAAGLKDLGGEKNDLAETAQQIAAITRGVLDLGDAFGVLGEKEQAALEGIVNIADGIARIASGDVLGGVIQGVGGLAKLGSQMFGESASVREGREIMERNTEAIQRLAQELAGFRATQDKISGGRTAINAFLGGGREGMAGVLGQWARGDIKEGHADMVKWLTRQLTKVGMSMQDLDALAEQFGITLRDKAGNIVPKALQDLAEALRLAEQGLVGFRDTLDDQIESLELEADIKDEATDAQSELNRALGLFQKFAPGMAGQFLGGDASTAEGRAAIEQGVRKLFDAFKAGTLQLEGLTRDEFLQLLRMIEGSLDELGTAGGVLSGAAETRLSVSITEVQANQLLTLQATAVDHLAAIRAHFTGSRSVSGTPVAVLPPNGGLGGSGGSIAVDMRGLTITIEAAGSDEQQLAAAGKAAGGAFGDEFANRFQAAWRGSGATSRASIRVKAEGAPQ